MKLVALILVFLVTRLVGLYLADNPMTYAPRETSTSGDVALYAGWADDVVNRDFRPYGDILIEYPPGSLPFIVLPALVGGDDGPYRPSFLLLMLIVDAAGLAGLIVLARRWGNDVGPWLWVLLIPMLGPIVWARLDLIPAVATIWAVERAAGGRWLSSGAWLGFGAIAKVYPGFLIPPTFMVAPRRRDFVLGAGVTLILPLLPYLTSFDGLLKSVVGYHSARGIQIESIWGSGLFLALERGRDVTLGSNYGAFHFSGALPTTMKVIALVLTVATIAFGTYLAWRSPRGDVKRLVGIMFATLVMIEAVGSVFSPQFLIWLFALGAAALCMHDSAVKLPALMLLGIAPMTQLIYPFFYSEMVQLDAFPIFVLCARNLLVLAAGIIAFLSLLGTRSEAPPRPEAQLAGAT